MPDQTVQLVVLAGAYVLAVVVTLGAIASSVFSYRFSRRLEAKRDSLSRLTRLENELASFRETVDSFSHRLARRTQIERKASRESTEPDSDSPSPMTGDPDDLVRAFRRRQG